MIEELEAFLAGDVQRVEQAVRAAAKTEIMPRFRQLAAHEIDEKTGPHDLVTIADQQAEEYLTKALTELLPGAVVVGEEAVSGDEGVLAALSGVAPVWIVDPVDGTRQFVRGEEGFCTLVALALDGELYASWTFAPVLDEMAIAIRGKGAVLNGEPLRAGASREVLEVATSHPDYTTEEQKRALLGLWTEGVNPRPCGSAGLEYLAIARGEVDATAFSWENSWDHAAGLLLVEEAGGTHSTLTGERFRIAGGNALPFTTGRDERAVERVLKCLRSES